MLSCMILLAIELDAHVSAITRTQHCAVSRCSRARLHTLVHDFTHDLNIVLTHITRQSFSKCLRENLNSRAVKYMQARVSRYEHTGY